MTAPDDLPDTVPPLRRIDAPPAPASSAPTNGHAPRAGHAAAHATPIVAPPAPAAARPAGERPRYFLRSREPGGEFDGVVLAVTDAARRRYFVTLDGVGFAEIDEHAFEGGDGTTWSLLELDEREMGELEVELGFARPVRGRDPLAELADDDEADDAADLDDPADEDDPAEVDARADDAIEAPIASKANLEAGPVDVADDPRAEPWTVDADGQVLDERDSRRDDAPTARADDAAPTQQNHPPAEQPLTGRDPRPVDDPEAPAPAASAPPPAPRHPLVAHPSHAAPPAARHPLTDSAAAIEQVALARGIASIAHRGQTDRTGAPYIDHPGRIAEQFDAVREPVEAASAWLHDVLEDTNVTPTDLFEAGVHPAVIDVVRLLTRTPDVPPEEYYRRIRGNPVARRVKLADIDDNSARWRLRRLDYEVQLRLIEKYRVARIALGAG